MKPLLVGEANPFSSAHRHALYPWPRNSAGARLADLLNLEPREYLKRFDRVNLFSVPPPSWYGPMARWQAGTILTSKPRRRLIVLLGARVAAAFNMADVPLWGHRDVTHRGVTTRFLRVPHPSGRCRIWNDPESAVRLRRLLRAYLKPRKEAFK